MDLRPLGKSGLSIPPVMVGGNVFRWTADASMSPRLLDRFLEVGLTAIDTADVYSHWAPGHHGGESETAIGDWLAGGGRRDRVVIATKVGMEMPDGKGLSRDWIVQSCDRSLQRLRTDRIDLYQAHRDDPNTPLEETLGAFASLIEAGKVRAIGASNYTAERLSEALAVSAREHLPRYESLQPHYNLLERPAYEDALEAVCRSEQLGVIPYYSLAAGFLTGKYRSEQDFGRSTRGDGVRKYFGTKGSAVLAALDAVAARLGASVAAVALAWLIARPGITAPIASATSPEQIEDMVQATQLTLSREDIQTLDAASAT